MEGSKWAVGGEMGPGPREVKSNPGEARRLSRRPGGPRRQPPRLPRGLPRRREGVPDRGERAGAAGFERGLLAAHRHDVPRKGVAAAGRSTRAPPCPLVVRPLPALDFNRLGSKAGDSTGKMGLPSCERPARAQAGRDTQWVPDTVTHRGRAMASGGHARLLLGGKAARFVARWCGLPLLHHFAGSVLDRVPVVGRSWSRPPRRFLASRTPRQGSSERLGRKVPRSWESSSGPHSHLTCPVRVPLCLRRWSELGGLSHP